MKAINKQSNFIKSPLNYTGGKYKLLKQIIPLFPEKINTFYDLFAGGCDVSINIEAEKIIANDINNNIVELFQFFKKNDVDTIIRNVEKVVATYELSNTKLNGYKYYNTNSLVGLKETNKYNYTRLRADYNENIFIDIEKTIVFYVLIIFGFNNQIRFNNKKLFNTPCGKRDFNMNLENKLISFKNKLDKLNIEFHSFDYKYFLDAEFEYNDFIYIDPPYLIANATYNEGNNWNIQKEVDLYNFLDEISSKGIKFALSNVVYHNGKTNEILKKWAKKYNVHYLNYEYKNSNYQKNKDSKSIEVLITNYKK